MSRHHQSDQKQQNKPKNLLATLSMMGLAIGATLLVKGGPWKSRAAAAATVVGLETVLESGGFFDGEGREKDRERRRDRDGRTRKDRDYGKRVGRERDEERSREGRRDRYLDRDYWERDEETNIRGGEWRNIDEWANGVRAETPDRRFYDDDDDDDEDYYEDYRRRQGTRARARTSRRGQDEGAGAGDESTSRRRRNRTASANERFDAKYEIEEV
ncbi:hypothetical protein ACMFMF_010422 [Clarireedia jacksonii]